MRAVIQRVKSASVDVEGIEISRIGEGLCCLIGVQTGDGEEDADFVARKICGLRIFDDANGVMNIDVGEIRGEILLISQFTLMGDIRKGRRPSWSDAEQPVRAQEIFDGLVAKVSSLHEGKVAIGKFQAAMEVHIVNNGPVTILLDSRKTF